MIKFILLGIGILFIIYLCLRWKILFGKITSIQFLTLMGSLLVLIIFFVLDFFSSSILEFFVGDLSKLSTSTIETYFSLLVTILIGFVGVIAVVLSVLYGAHITASTSEGEREKLSEQNFIWFCFLVYFIITMVVLFIYPLMNRLSSI